MSDSPRLGIIICSTRPGRQGGIVAQWAFEHAKAHTAFTAELVDLAEVNLPLLDEPHHPRLQKYTKPHTLAWSAKVKSLDAFVFVTPEYDYAMPAALLNALQFLALEWAHKPCSFLSYGGISGGLRGVQMSKQVVTALGMVPIQEAVAQPLFSHHIKDGVFAPGEAQDKAFGALLDSLARWETALKPLRG